MEFTMQPYGVYIKTDAQSCITAINSSAFLPDTSGWMKIDEGFGDKYHHAQGNYLPGPLTDMRGIYRYKIVIFVDWPEGKIIHEFFHEGEEYGIFERTQEEMDADYTPPEPQPEADNSALTEQVAALQKQVDEQAAMLASYEAAYKEGVQSA